VPEGTITLWRPVGQAELERFNDHIVGAIELVATYR
jgi:hypothetical protein